MLLNRIVNWLRAGAITLGVLFLLGFGLETELSMPYNARVFINPHDNRYISPPCLRLTPEQERQLAEGMKEQGSYRDSMSVLVKVTGLYPAIAQEMHEQKFRAEQSCADQDGFSMTDRSVSGILLQRVGVLPPLPRRWNKDGSWNW